MDCSARRPGLQLQYFYYPATGRHTPQTTPTRVQLITVLDNSGVPVAGFPALFSPVG